MRDSNNQSWEIYRIEKMRRALIDCSNHASSVLHADSHTVISFLDISMIERIEKYAEESQSEMIMKSTSNRCQFHHFWLGCACFSGEGCSICCLALMAREIRNTTEKVRECSGIKDQRKSEVTYLYRLDRTYYCVIIFEKCNRLQTRNWVYPTLLDFRAYYFLLLIV